MRYLVDSRNYRPHDKKRSRPWCKCRAIRVQRRMAKEKKLGIGKSSFSHEWVLILDADECLPPEAEDEIRMIVSNPNENTPVLD